MMSATAIFLIGVFAVGLPTLFVHVSIHEIRKGERAAVDDDARRRTARPHEHRGCGSQIAWFRKAAAQRLIVGR